MARVRYPYGTGEIMLAVKNHQDAVELVNVKGCLLLHDACKTTCRACR